MRSRTSSRPRSRWRLDVALAAALEHRARGPRRTSSSRAQHGGAVGPDAGRTRDRSRSAAPRLIARTLPSALGIVPRCQHCRSRPVATHVRPGRRRRLVRRAGRPLLRRAWPTTPCCARCTPTTWPTSKAHLTGFLIQYWGGPDDLQRGARASSSAHASRPVRDRSGRARRLVSGHGSRRCGPAAWRPTTRPRSSPTSRWRPRHGQRRAAESTGSPGVGHGVRARRRRRRRLGCARS